VKLAGRIFPSLTEQKVLLDRRGRDDRARRDPLRRAAAARMAVANRTLDRAEALARRFNAESIELRDLPERLPNTHHHFLHRELAADHRQGHDGAHGPRAAATARYSWWTSRPPGH